MNGTIVTVVSDRGFFFIKGEDTKQYFGHLTALVVKRRIYDIEVGDAVTFDPASSLKGPRATDIRVTRLDS